MSKNRMIGWAAVIAFVIVAAAQAIAGAGPAGKAGTGSKIEQTKAGLVTNAECECICGATPPPGQTTCE